MERSLLTTHGDKGREVVHRTALLRDEQLGCLATGHVAIVDQAILAVVAVIDGLRVLHLLHGYLITNAVEVLTPDAFAFLRLLTSLDDVGCHRHMAHGIVLRGNGLQRRGLLDGDGCSISGARRGWRGAVGGVVDGSTVGRRDDGHGQRLCIDAAHRREVGLMNGSGSATRLHGVVEGFVLHRAPDVMLQARVVNERIAVLLQRCHSLVALQLHLVDGVALRPFHEHLQEPVGEGRIGGAIEAIREVGATPCGEVVLVTGRHIEIGTCHVALDFIVRLEALAAVARHLAATHQAVVVCGVVGHRAHLAKRQVATAVVHVAIGGHDVEGIVAHVARLAEPTLRHEVFAIVGIALLAVVRPLIRTANHVARRIRVPVAQKAIGTAVGGLVGVPQSGIADVGMFVDDATEGRLQFLSLQPVGILIVVARVVGALCHSRRGDGQ